jgi:hypothetical protein
MGQMVDIIGLGIASIFGILAIYLWVTVKNVIPSGNMSSTTLQLLNLVEIFMAIAVIIAIIYSVFKQ